MIKKILVPLDGSELSERALDAAADIARAAHARIELLFVHVPGVLAVYDTPYGIAEPKHLEERYLSGLADELNRTVSVAAGIRVVSGDAVEKICDQAKRLHAELIVMATHGRTGFSRAWIGSVADGVIRGSAVPVLLLRASEGKAESVPRLALRRVLVALDGSPHAEEILHPVSTLARLTGAQLTLTRIVEPVPQYTMDMVASYALPVPFVDEEATASQVKDAEKYVRDIAATLAPLSVDTRVVVNDHPAAAILALVGETKSDVVAMTTHGRGASRLLVGSVADKVLRATPKPLLLYRPLARIVRKHAGSKRRPARKPRAKATVNT